MLRVRDAAQVVRGFGEKVVGLNLEVAGTLLGNDRLSDRGRSFEKAGGERIRAAEEETKATARQAEARFHESKQRAYQSDPGPTKSPGRDPSPGRAAAESAKGAVKEVAGKVSGSDRLEAEGREQRERGKDEAQAAKHDAKAAAHREKAEVHRDIADRQKG